MSNSLGIFDSGLGGLTVLKQILAVNGYDRIVYFGDTGRVPYGTRSRETIQKYAMQDVRFLLSKQIDEIIIACGTVSANAIDQLKSAFSLPITGVIDVSAQAAARETKNGRIGVIGTKATIASRVYLQKLHTLAPQVQVFSVACPLFVPLVEYGFAKADSDIVDKTCQFYLQELKEKEIDTLILGCTHYPLLKKPIERFFDGRVTLIDSGVEMAKRLAASGRKTTTPRVEFYVSDEAETFGENAAVFLGSSVAPVAQCVDIQKY